MYLFIYFNLCGPFIYCRFYQPCFTTLFQKMDKCSISQENPKFQKRWYTVLMWWNWAKKCSWIFYLLTKILEFIYSFQKFDSNHIILSCWISIFHIRHLVLQYIVLFDCRVGSISRWDLRVWTTWGRVTWWSGGQSCSVGSWTRVTMATHRTDWSTAVMRWIVFSFYFGYWIVYILTCKSNLHCQRVYYTVLIFWFLLWNILHR